MSDFMPRDILPDLWEEILNRQWLFLEKEESPQKLEERKKLEACLKDFLCLVPHDRKFFIPETAHVLRKTVMEMDGFTANRGKIAFESISQYANNLFTKPWRKEFRVLKTYSGFFQHEIKSNLLDAEKLFEAMGYRRLSDDTFVLDGPICPDQVTNVSRDAMIAYVECQIMKNIYIGVEAAGFNCTWQDVYQYREQYIGGTSKSTRGLIYAMQERQVRKDKLKHSSADNCYATIQHSPQDSVALPMVGQYQNCSVAGYHVPPPTQQLPNGQCVLHNNINNNNVTNNNINNNNNNNNNCAVHPSNYMYTASGTVPNNGKLISSYPANYMQQQQQQQQVQQHQPQQHPCIAQVAQPHMSHSRSLEHYNELHAPLPHRHSFDHQQHGCTSHHYHQPYQPPHGHIYESAYDRIDGGGSMGGSSSVSYAPVPSGSNNCNVNAAYMHPYNVKGNRVPLPFTISNQLNSPYNTPGLPMVGGVPSQPPSVSCNGVKGDPYASVDTSYAAILKAQNYDYYTQPGLQNNSRNNVGSTTNVGGTKDFQTYRQNSFPSEQLIEFDDRAPLTSHEYHSQLKSNSFDCERSNETRHSRRNMNRVNMNATYAQPKDMVCSHSPVTCPAQQYQTALGTASTDDMCGNHLYARPIPRGVRTKLPKNMTDKYLGNTNTELDDIHHKMQTELRELSENGGILINGGSGGANRRKLSTHTNERDTTDLSCDSVYEDFENVAISEKPQSSHMQFTKNQDGVGSFEQWNYVFKNLEKSGYNKDLGERDDLIMQTLDLNSLNLEDRDKRRSNNTENVRIPKETTIEKSRTLEKTSMTEKRERERERQTERETRAISAPKQEKSILKQSSGGTGAKRITATSNLKSTTTTKNGTHDNNNGYQNGDLSTPWQEREPRKKNSTNVTTKGGKALQSSNAGTHSSASGSNRSKNAKLPLPVATQVIVSSPTEWSCRFCTFLNPNTKRVCEMCAKTKDFNLDATISKTPTCV